MSSTIKRLKAVSSQSVLAATGAVMAASSAQAELIIFDVDETANFESSVQIDLNDDGRDDFRFSVGIGKLPREGGDIDMRVREGLEFGLVSTKISKKVMGADTAEMKPILKRGKRGIFSDKKVGPVAPYATRFEEGDVINKDSGPFSSKARLYDDRGANGGKIDDGEMDMIRLNLIDEENFGPFADVDDSGYIGLFIDFFETDGEHLGDNRLAIVEEEDDRPRLLRFYGWAEIARGSLNVIRIGFQTTPNTGAPIPRDPVGVPEPASLPLMALGAAGLLAMRRRMAA